MPKPPSNSKQLALVTVNKTERKEWTGMPEFFMEDLKPWKTLIVNFTCPEDLEKFAATIDQKLTPSTRSIWFPKQAQMQQFCTTRYVDES